jgi:hypothetical protein
MNQSQIDILMKDVLKFQKNLEEECHSYGWNRCLIKACELYRDNGVLEQEKKNLIEANEKLYEIINQLNGPSEENVSEENVSEKDSD